MAVMTWAWMFGYYFSGDDNALICSAIFNVGGFIMITKTGEYQ